VRSTYFDGYRIPLERHDLKECYEDRFEVKVVYDPIMDLPPLARQKAEVLAWKRENLLNIQKCIIQRCKELGISVRAWMNIMIFLS
jgi:hypothetical protein